MRRRATTFIACLLVPIGLIANPDLKAQLDLYVGRWLGVFSVRAPDIDYEETFSVEQTYWWKADELRGISVVRRQSGTETSRAVNTIRDNQVISEVSKGDSVQVYYGILANDGLVWVPANLERVTDYQLKETFTEIDGERVLVTNGYDTFNNEGKPALLFYQGQLIREQE